MVLLITLVIHQWGLYQKKRLDKSSTLYVCSRLFSLQ